MRGTAFTTDVRSEAARGETALAGGGRALAAAGLETAHAPDGEETKRDAEGGPVRLRALALEDALFLACCATGAFLARLLLVVCVEQVITPDGVGYVALARELAAGQIAAGMSTYWPPLYPALVALSTLVFGDVEFAGRFVSVVAGSLVVLPVYALARVDYGKRVARLAALMAALHPLLVYYSTLVLTEATYTLLFACGVLAGRLALRRGARAEAFLCAGAVFGACYLLKPEAAGFVLLLLAMTTAAKFLDRRLATKTMLENAAALCSGFLLLAAPYLAYLRSATGHWTPSGKVRAHLWQGSRATGEAAAQMESLVPDASTAVAQLARALKYEYELFNLIFPTTFVLVVGLALFRAPWTRARARRELYLAAFVVATLAGYAVTLPNVRFLSTLLPILVCWAALGMTEFDGWGRATLAAGRVSPRLNKVIVPLALAVLLAPLAPVFVYLMRGDKWGDYGGQKRAALWIKEQAGATAPGIMSTVPIVAFYAGARHLTLADFEYAGFAERARREGAQFVIANERELKGSGLRPLLDEGAAHAGLRLVHRVELARGHKVLVYAVENPTGAATED